MLLYVVNQRRHFIDAQVVRRHTTLFDSSLLLRCCCGLPEANTQHKGQPDERNKDISSAASFVVRRPRGGTESALPLQSVIHATQPSKIGQEERRLEDPPHAEIIRVAMQTSRQDDNGQGEPASLVEEKDLIGVVC